MAAEIAAHGPAHRFRHDREIGEKCDWRCGGEAGIFFDEPVQGRDIGAMMAIMVDLHGRRIDIGLERVEPIAERRNLETQARPPRMRARISQASQPPPWRREPKCISIHYVV